MLIIHSQIAQTFDANWLEWCQWSIYNLLHAHIHSLECSVILLIDNDIVDRGRHPWSNIFYFGNIFMFSPSCTFMYFMSLY